MLRQPERGSSCGKKSAIDSNSILSFPVSWRTVEKERRLCIVWSISTIEIDLKRLANRDRGIGNRNFRFAESGQPHQIGNGAKPLA